jgi:serine protease Do
VQLTFACSARGQNNSPLVAQEEAAIRAAVARVADSVVQIRTIGGFEQVDHTLLPDGPTTGLVISADGWIVASAFNFVHQPASILVIFASGNQAPAELVATDHSRKLVLLKAQGVSQLAVPQFVPSGEIRVGLWAVAVGRTFNADRTNISVGIVSALDRMFGKVIQTDADVSTANYGGPLVDIRGRVLGVLVPIAPQSASEVAGAEWYDSGIGFAVPLGDIRAALERMKAEQDQYAGLLGIGLAGKNPHQEPAKLATVMPNSPAGKAGLKKGDTIIQIDGTPIATQTDLRFALGSRYAGEEIRVLFTRGNTESPDQLERTLTLSGKLDPFRHAFLGILPMRPDVEPKEKSDDSAKAANKSAAGVVVRLVYPGGPAAAAGIRAGDRLVRIGEADVESIQSAIDATNGVLPDEAVAVRLLRDGQPIDAKVTADRLPTNVLSDLPSAYSTPFPPADANALPAAAIRELRLAEFSQQCKLYVPPSHGAGRAAGVLLWLHAPGEPPDDKLFRQWQPICDRDGLLLVVPTADDVGRWERTELEYLRRLTERVLADYRVDPRRVVVFGQNGGGSMAYLLALVNRGLFRGVATTDAALPRTVDPPTSDPTARLAVFAGLPAGVSRMAQFQLGIEKLADAGYPVTVATIADSAGRLSEDERQHLARWIDTLDRF